MNAYENSTGDTPQHLKRVSRIKHIILQKYLRAWATILGSANQRLCYIDCYAGPGIYEFEGQQVDGSPIIAIKAAKEYLSRSNKKMTIALVEKDDEQRSSLERELRKVQPYGEGLTVNVYAEDASGFVTQLLRDVPCLAPSFFMVDPYNHPLTIPILNDILKRPKTEALITFMFYRINMDAGNSRTSYCLDKMFGSDDWRKQPFLARTGFEREIGFLEYFKAQIQSKYPLNFRIRFDPEDRVRGNRTKYYLIHASNHVKAALLMKDIMHPLGDQEGLFDYGGTEELLLFSFSPKEEKLKEYLLNNYAGKKVGFDRLREETWRLPFRKSQYHAVVKQLIEEKKAEAQPITSKTKRGLQGNDCIVFFPLKD